MIVLVSLDLEVKKAVETELENGIDDGNILDNCGTSGEEKEEERVNNGVDNGVDDRVDDTIAEDGTGQLKDGTIRFETVITVVVTSLEYVITDFVLTKDPGIVLPAGGAHE